MPFRSDRSDKEDRTGGQLIAAALVKQQIDHVFCVPGESYLDVLDALHDTAINITVCRQEGGASMMAEAHGKLTGRPGICMVTRGPGIANALAGIHVAMQDSTPLIVFVGQIDTRMREREAFQEVDYKAVFSTQTKWTVEIDHADRIPELVSRAFHIAMSGRPGPVVIALPEDMLSSVAKVVDAPYIEAVESAAPTQELRKVYQLLKTAKNPIAIVGGSRWTQTASEQLQVFSEKTGIAVAAQFRRQGIFPGTHPNYIGDVGLGINPQLIERINAADVVILLGGRMSESPSQGYTLFDIPLLKQKLIHVHSDSQELNRVYRADLAINSTPTEFIDALNLMEFEQDWYGNTQTDRQNYLSWSNPSSVTIPGELQMGQIMEYLNNTLEDDAILTNGAGNYATWLHRFYPYPSFNDQLAPTSGSMGYGLPAAVGAKRVHPDRQVVCFAGDGCFMMHGQEFATAVQYDLNIIVLIFDNSMYGTIRMHQEMHYPGRVSGTNLKNPDFSAYAKAFGGYGERVERTEDFAAAFERAVASGKPAILHCILDSEAITPSKTLTQIRNKK